MNHLLKIRSSDRPIVVCDGTAYSSRVFRRINRRCGETSWRVVKIRDDCHQEKNAERERANFKSHVEIRPSAI